jgi:hypothetical protein
MVMSVRALPAIADFFVGITWGGRGAPGDAFADTAALGLDGWEERENERKKVGDVHDDVLTAAVEVGSVCESREWKCWT